MIQKKRKLSNKERALILYSYIKTGDETTAKTVFDSLSEKCQLQLDTLLETYPLFLPEDIQDSLSHFVNLFSENQKLYQNVPLVGSSSLDSSDAFIFGWLSKFSPEYVLSFLDPLPTYVAALILKFMSRDYLVQCILLMSDKKRKSVMRYVLEMKSPNKDFIIELNHFLNKKMNTELISKETNRGEDNVLEIMDYISIYNIDSETLGVSQDMEKYKEKLFNIENLLRLKNKDLELVLKPFKNERDFSLLVLNMDDLLRSKYLDQCSERLKLIVLERLEKLNEEPDVEKKEQVIKINISKRYRILLNKGEIASYAQPQTDNEA